MDFGPQVTEYADKRVGVYGGKFFPFHRGHLSYILKAQSMVDVLFVVVQYDEKHEKNLITGTGFEWIDPRTREAWISEQLKPFPNIRVLSQYEHRSDNHMDDPLITQTYEELHELVGGHIDVIFSNTHDYDSYFAKYLPNAEHVVFYENRDVIPISASEIRAQGINASWDYLPTVVQNHYKKRVAICGIESSGKTHISKMLAANFNTVTVSEYGRKYYDDKNSYTSVDTPNDYLDIAAGHVHLLNENMSQANKILISDTDMIYTQFFYEQSYGEKNPVLDALIKAKADKIDHWIWLEPHNYHELDGTRLNIEEQQRKANREHLFSLYEYYGVKLHVVDEKDRDVRYQACVKIVDNIIDNL